MPIMIIKEIILSNDESWFPFLFGMKNSTKIQSFRDYYSNNLSSNINYCL